MLYLCLVYMEERKLDALSRAEYDALVEAVKEPRRFGIELLYTDHEGSQRTITYFVVTPRGEDKWFCSEVRHWNLDRPDPRGV